MTRAAVVFLSLILVACLPTTEHESGEDVLVGDPDTPWGGKADTGWNLSQAAANTCTTAVAARLTHQLLEEIECMRPGTVARIDHIPGVSLNGGTPPYLQGATADALARAASRHSDIRINSALRSLAQQYLLYTWDTNNWCSHVVYIAARPGTSNHESGRALDIDNYNAVYDAMLASGFSWLGGSDPVHYDYWQGADLRDLSVLAFQRVWNRNHTNDRLSESGSYNAATAKRLGRAPADGFPVGASCHALADSIEHAIEVDWVRRGDGVYDLRAQTSSEVRRIEYHVDGYLVGSADRGDGSSFPAEAVFSNESIARDLVVMGYDADDELVGLGTGLLDVTAGTAVYIRQQGAQSYEIGLERPSSDISAIEVRVDGYLLTDGASGSSRSRRNAVRSQLAQTGKRTVQITTFGPSDDVRGSLYREFTVR